MSPSSTEIFESQGVKQVEVRLSSSSERIQKLQRLKASIEKFEDKILKALRKDLNKSVFEASVTEIFFVYGEIDFAIKNLRKWMKPKTASKVFSNFFSRNRIYYEAKGRCLIISPWNYPFQLALSPLISAIAAGNCSIVKPSELSPETSSVIADIIKDCFDPSEIACCLGGVELSQELLKLPFNHIFFTGSTAVGKIVMEAAAKNLSSVTLELGGKSPAIIAPDADIQTSAEKIAWGKLLNAGQTCIAPDYVIVPQAEQDAFVGFYIQAVEKFYPQIQKNPDYGRIINDSHFNRLKGLVEEALSAGARIPMGGKMEVSNRFISPAVITSLNGSEKLLEEEIFGPILPVLTYQNPEEVLSFVGSKSKPLALYIFGSSKKQKNFFLKHIQAGGVCVNDVLVHISNPNLPFGGVNASGIGSSHGFHGFKNFSHEKAVVFQSKLSFNHLVYPPFKEKSWVLKLLRKIM